MNVLKPKKEETYIVCVDSDIQFREVKAKNEAEAVHIISEVWQEVLERFEGEIKRTDGRRFAKIKTGGELKFVTFPEMGQ